ncbi:MAG: hypothetical protein LBV12_06410 [Puniceicoccales bacterium]|jgi:hypothetical protein|nr:hypothetical protein [Puniceicoccales bacterium]
MNPDQSNTRAGSIPVLANENLLGKRSRLVTMLAAATGLAAVALPTTNDPGPLYLLDDEGDAGAIVPAQPLIPDKNQRGWLRGTCAPGDTLVLADAATEADRGMIRKLPATAGTYRVVGWAEETGVDGQLALFRPAPFSFITVA